MQASLWTTFCIIACATAFSCLRWERLRRPPADKGSVLELAAGGSTGFFKGGPCLFFQVWWPSQVEEYLACPKPHPRFSQTLSSITNGLPLWAIAAIARMRSGIPLQQWNFKRVFARPKVLAPNAASQALDLQVDQNENLSEALSGFVVFRDTNAYKPFCNNLLFPVSISCFCFVICLNGWNVLGKNK